MKSFREKISVLVVLLVTIVPKPWNHWKSSPAKMVIPMPSKLYWDGA